MHPLLAKQVYTLVGKLRGEYFWESFRELDASQWYSREQLAELQWNRLKKLLEESYRNVPYYRRVFQKLGATPGDIRNFQDFSRLPVLTKDIIRENFPDMLAKNRRWNSFSYYHTSGSTGEPLVICLDKRATGAFHAAQFRRFYWYGVDIGDRGVRIWGVPLKWSGRLKEQFKDFITNRYSFSAFDLSLANLTRCFRFCQRYHPRFLYGYASALYKFCQFIQEKGFSGNDLNLKVVISTSEILYPHQRELIEQTFGCRVANEYGASEVGLIAFECPSGGIHLTSENNHLELLWGGKSVNPGEMGEVIVTSLRNSVLPFIRYRLGDLASFSQNLCSCGRGLPLLTRVEGRDNDILICPDGHYLHSEIFAYINRTLIKQGIGLKEFKIIQKKPDYLVVYLPESNKADPRTRQFLEKEIKHYASPQMRIEFNFVEKILPEKSGKMRYFISEIEQKN